jgi:hypothetical protein
MAEFWNPTGVCRHPPGARLSGNSQNGPRAISFAAVSGIPRGLDAGKVFQRGFLAVPTAGVAVYDGRVLFAQMASSYRSASRRAMPRLSRALPSACRSPVSRQMAAASWQAVMASSNRRAPQKASPRLPRLMPSACRSPVSRKMATASWQAATASSNRRAPARATPRLFRALPSPLRSPAFRKMAGRKRRPRPRCLGRPCRSPVPRKMATARW